VIAPCIALNLATQQSSTQIHEIACKAALKMWTLYTCGKTSFGRQQCPSALSAAHAKGVPPCAKYSLTSLGESSMLLDAKRGSATQQHKYILFNKRELGREGFKLSTV
jgi:hypothetical protein